MKTLALLLALLLGAGFATRAQSAPGTTSSYRQNRFPRQLAAGQPPAPAGPLLLTGQVRQADSLGTRPLAGAKVSVAVGPGEQATQTDAAGGFQLVLPAAVRAGLPDSIAVRASKLFYTAQTLKVKNGPRVAPLRFTLQLASLRTRTEHHVAPRPLPPPRPDHARADADHALWPPPQCSTEEVLNQRYFARAHTLAGVNAILSDALAAATYDEPRYYYAPNGFMLITRLEQTTADGVALPGNARWSITVPDDFGWSLSAYLKALFAPGTGHFRVIAFAVTNQPINDYSAAPQEDTAISWLKHGANILADSIGALPYGPAYRCTALIYEFEQSPERPGRLVLPGRLTAAEHLTTSHIAGALPKLRP